MEITHTVKSKENTLLIEFDKHNQNRKLPSIIRRVSFEEKIDQSQLWTHHISQLPKEVRAIIYKRLFNATDQIATNLAAIKTKMLLRSFYDAQLACPLTVGNKVFTVSDLLTLTTTERKQLIRIGNNRIANAEEIRGIKNLPDHIKEGLEIITPDKAIFRDRDCPTDCSTNNPTVSFCGCGLCLSGCLSATIPCGIGGCHASPLWWFPGATFLGCSIALPLMWEMFHHLPCIKAQKVYVFSAKKA